MENQSSQPTRMAWRLNHDLEVYSGLSVPFWRKMIAKRQVPITKVGNATLILDSTVREVITRRAGLHEVQPLSDQEKEKRNATRTANQKEAQSAAA